METLLEMNVHMNHYALSMQFYLQISRTAMGTSCAPSLANLFMGRFEKDLLDGYHLQPLIWLCSIDDMFIIWTHSEDEMYKFVAHTNSVHPNN